MLSCPKCGAGSDNQARFCSACGARLGGEESPRTSTEGVLWEGKPHLKEIGTNTRYVLTTQRLLVTSGLLARREEQIDLARVKDIRLTQGFSDRMLGIGQIELLSTDPSTPEFRLIGVSDPRRVRDLIWEAVNRRRKTVGVSPREIL
ncbi:MAG: PH domain-containing protein [Clostridia bacterium]|nr:PH domain-containing protein [Clostridia bacterium]